MYKPYMPNDQLLYVKILPSNPSQIIKQLPASLSDCLSNIFSNKEVFDMRKGEYEKTLRESGYTDKRQFTQIKRT